MSDKQIDETEQKPSVIYLQPWCDGCETHCRGYDDGRTWCIDDVWSQCEYCGRGAVKYVLAEQEK